MLHTLHFHEGAGILAFHGCALERLDWKTQVKLVSSVVHSVVTLLKCLHLWVSQVKHSLEEFW